MVKTDKELIEDFLNGDHSAFNIIARKYQEKIYWHALRMLGNHDDADELTQEVLVTMYKKLHTFAFNSSLYTWIYKITSTRSINYLRKKMVGRFFSFSTDDDLPGPDNFSLVKSVEDKEKLAKVISSLDKLPPRQREVFVLRTFEGLSYNEISEITGKSIGSLKASYFHALNKITDIKYD